MTTDLLQQAARTLSSGLASNAYVPGDDESLYEWVANPLAIRIPRHACCPECLPRARRGVRDGAGVGRGRPEKRDAGATERVSGARAG
jgi:hypothetical protein